MVYAKKSTSRITDRYIKFTPSSIKIKEGMQY